MTLISNKIYKVIMNITLIIKHNKQIKYQIMKIYLMKIQKKKNQF